MIKSVSALAAFNMTILTVLFVAPEPALAAEEGIAGYCLYFHENSIYYRSPVFRAAKFNRHRFVEDWKHHLYESGVNYFNGVTCRAWPGGVDAVASAAAAAATPPEYTQRIVDIDWIPKDSVRAFGGGSTPLAGSTRPDVAPPRSAPARKPATAKPTPSPSKYVEVAGPNGTVRLSPEVAARNQAAADDYRRKMDRHASAKTDHERKLALHQQSVTNAAAEKREHERRLATNAAQVATHQAALLEHKKLAAKPPGVNAVYRGFNGPTCELARRSALFGSGTSKGSHFAEVTQDLSGMPRSCIVQGWSWNTLRTGSSRQ